MPYLFSSSEVIGLVEKAEFNQEIKASQTHQDLDPFIHWQLCLPAAERHDGEQGRGRGSR